MKKEKMIAMDHAIIALQNRAIKVSYLRGKELKRLRTRIQALRKIL